MKRAGGSGPRLRGQTATAFGGLLHEVLDAPKVRVPAHAHFSAALGREVVCYPEHPAARDSTLSMRLRCSLRPSAALLVTGAATSDAFDSPQGSEDYRDVFEKRASTHSAPRRRAPKNKEAL